MPHGISKRSILVVVLLLTAMLSCTVLTKVTTSAEFHQQTIQALDDKKITVMELTAATAITSTAISSIPGDAATPIANQISELTSYLMLITCAIYLEKFLLTTTGYLAFRVLIPIACLLFAVYLFVEREALRVLSMKLALFGILIYLIVPVSVQVTNIIEMTFQESIEQPFAVIEEINETAETDSNFLIRIFEKMKDGVTDLAATAKSAFSTFVDAIAVLIITSCIIPVFVLLFFVWVTKLIFDIDLSGVGNAAGKLLKHPKQKESHTTKGNGF